jgi:hypothetical protein
MATTADSFDLGVVVCIVENGFTGRILTLPEIVILGKTGQEVQATAEDAAPQGVSLFQADRAPRIREVKITTAA